MKKSQDDCVHKKWRILTPTEGDRNGLSECRECGLWLSHAERLNWESLKNQKVVSYISFCFSIVAIVISVFALV